MKNALIRATNRATPAIIFLVAMLVRLLGITSRPIWYDEAFSILFSEKGLKAMLIGTLSPDALGAAADIHPLAYYTLLDNWMKVFGNGLVSARMLSVLVGLTSVVLVYYLLKELFPVNWLVNSGTLAVALAPMLVHYSQEIRMYALLAFSLIAATYALWGGLHSDNWRWWVVFAICSALAQYTQNLAAFYLVPLAFTPVILRRWDKLKMVLIAGVGALLLYLPWLVHLPAQFAKLQHAYWIDRPSLSTVFTTLLVFVTNLPIDNRLLPFVLAISVLVVILAAYQTILALRYQIPSARRAAWLTYLAFTPVALALIFSQWQPVFIERAFLASAFMFWLWLVWALTATRLPRLIQIPSLVLLLGVVVIGLTAHLTYVGSPYGPYQALDASLAGRIQPGDVIIHSNKMTFLPSLYFQPSLPQAFISDIPGNWDDTLAPATQRVLGIAGSTSLTAATAGAHRVWFVIFQDVVDASLAAGQDNQSQLTWLSGHFHHVESETWGPILLSLFTH